MWHAVDECSAQLGVKLRKRRMPLTVCRHSPGSSCIPSTFNQNLGCSWRSFRPATRLAPFGSKVGSHRCMVYVRSAVFGCPSPMRSYLVTPPVMMLAFRLSELRKQCDLAWILLGLCGITWIACCAARKAALPAVLAMDGSLWYTGTQYRCAPYVVGVAVSVLGQEGTARAASKLHGILALLSWAILAACAYFGGGGPLLGFEIPMERWPFSPEAARMQFVLGRPLVGAAAGYLLWRNLNGLELCLNKVLTAPIWRPLARLSYSAYMLQVVNFAVAAWLLAPLTDATSRPAKAVAALSTPALVCVCYAWAVLYTLFAFALALVSYIAVEVAGMALGQRLTLKLRPRPILKQPLVA